MSLCSAAKTQAGAGSLTVNVQFFSTAVPSCVRSPLRDCPHGTFASFCTILGLRADHPPNPFPPVKPRETLILVLLTVGAFLIQGYHPAAEDAEIYLPAIEKILDPRLFPSNTQFFAAHAHITAFSDLIAASVRWTHLPLDAVLLVWQIGSIFLLLLGCWKLSGRCFRDPKARWAGVALLGTLLTLPVAGTALYVVDQYFNPRNLAAFAGIFAIHNILGKKYVWGCAWLVFAVAVHPLMAFFSASFCVLLFLTEQLETKPALALFWSPLGNWFAPATPAYHQAALLHPFHYIMKWAWYEWLGIAGPIPILWWFGRKARTQQSWDLARMCQALIIYDLIYWAGACVLSIPARFEVLARLQPLRSLHLLYILLIVFAGGFLGEFVLKNRAWRWIALFLPLCTGMFLAQRVLFPASGHVEWTRSASKNPWAQAFTWIRENTPEDSLFALDPLHMRVDGEDAQGFRAIAQRSMLADIVKDSGAVSMFPALAEEWQEQVQAQSGWRNFQLRDFQRLQAEYHVSWVVVQQPGVAGLDCPYQNQAVRVCRLD